MFNFYEVHQYELDVVHHHRALKYKSHLHNEFETIFLFEGEQGLIVNGSEYVLHEGDCAVIFPNVPHSYTRPDSIKKVNNAADSAIIFMPADALYAMFPDTRGSYPDECIINADTLNENAVLAFHKIFEEASINAQIGWAYIIFSHTIPLLMKNTLLSLQNSDTITRLLSYISLNFRKSLTLDMISDELGINKYYISRVFSNQIKVSFRTYLNVLRTNHAASLIKISDDNLEDIATDSGFESTRSFYRIFKDIYGASPSQYRKMIRRYSIY